MSLNGIARELNTQDILTRRVKAGAWTNSSKE